MLVELEAVGTAGSPTWVLDLEAVEEHRRREMIEGATPAAQVAALVERLLGHGLFGEWTVERPAPPSLRVPADVARGGQRDVLVVAETLEGRLRPVVGELLHKATQLAPLLRGRVSALIAGAGAPAHVEALAAFGATRVLVAADDGFLAGSEAYAALLAAVIERERPGLVILPATVFGRDLAPRVAARLGLGLTGECVDLSVDGAGRVLQHKPAFGGSVVALIASRVQPEMATVRPGMLGARDRAAGTLAEVVQLADRPPADRVRVLERRTDAEAAAELDEAAIVVGVGMGLGGPAHLAQHPGADRRAGWRPVRHSRRHRRRLAAEAVPGRHDRPRHRAAALHCSGSARRLRAHCRSAPGRDDRRHQSQRQGADLHARVTTGSSAIGRPLCRS